MVSLDDIISRYSGRSDLIAVLEDIQEAYGYVSEEHMRRVEQKLRIPLVEIYGVVTFYSDFKLKPPGKHIIRVCTGTTCHAKGSDEIHEHITKKLGIRDRQTTKDGKFTLQFVNCLGACSSSPNMMIDDIVYNQLTVKKVDGILKKIR
ncbi:MAG: NADH-quinone oxidoreductase subunit NuoE [Candidatus Altiarchaeota archaeon]